MNGNKALIDTNILLYFLKGVDNVKPFFDNHIIYFSFITELEVLSFSDLVESQRYAIKKYLSRHNIVGYSNEIRDLTIKIRIDRNLKLPDAIIAATALHYDLFIITADKKFRQVDDLRCLYYDPSK